MAASNEHHILGQQFRNNVVVQMLTSQTGFSIDTPQNLTGLPVDKNVALAARRASHPGGHLASYFDGQAEFLERIEDSADFQLAQNGDAGAANRIRTKVDDFIGVMEIELTKADGRLRPNTGTQYLFPPRNRDNQ